LINYLGSASHDRQHACRNEINPAKFRALLPDMFILDLVRDKGKIVGLTMRLMGTGLANFMERTPTKVSTVGNILRP